MQKVELQPYALWQETEKTNGLIHWVTMYEKSGLNQKYLYHAMLCFTEFPQFLSAVLKLAQWQH